MVERGGCTFAQKTRNIQKVGGDIALVTENSDNEDFTTLIMSDDGSGAGLHIPSVMISKADGAFIEKYVDGHTQVKLNI